jgi:hypothetical protein
VGLDAIGNLGQGFSGVLNISGAWTGDKNLGTTANLVSAVTSPVGIIALIATNSNAEIASVASSLASAITSTASFGKALFNAAPQAMTDLQALLLLSNPYSHTGIGLASLTTGWLGTPTSPGTTITLTGGSPITTIQIAGGPASVVPYDPSPLPDTLPPSVGGGSSVRGTIDDDEL